MPFHATVLVPAILSAASALHSHGDRAESAPAKPQSASEQPGAKQAAQGGIAGATCACTGDLNGDGSVGPADLSILLGAWGGGGVADLNQDFVVDAADLSILLGAWGACPSAPPNDHCAQAIPASTLSIQNYFCTYGADTDGPPLSNADCTIGGFNQIESDVWFSYQAPGDGQLEVGTCNIGWDTRIAIYGSLISGLSPCPSTGLSFASFLGCNDDYPGCGFGSYVKVPVSQGEHYKIRIGGYAGFQGEGYFALNYTPDGYDCEHAIKVVNPIATTITGTTLDKSFGVDTPNCVEGDGASTWYWFMAPCNIPGANMSVSLCNPGTDFDTVLTIWRIALDGTCAQTLIACNDDSPQAGCQIGGLNRRSRVSFETDPGWIYYVQVSGYLGATGNYEMTVTMDSCP
ncbi:MAG: hypothetical protein U0572_16935 [Phycisphaerales bacterium]